MLAGEKIRRREWASWARWGSGVKVGARGRGGSKMNWRVDGYFDEAGWVLQLVIGGLLAFC